MESTSTVKSTEDYPDIMEYEGRCEDLERINAKLLEALELYHEIGRRKSDTCKNSAWKMRDQVAFEKARDAIREAKGAS